MKAAGNKVIVIMGARKKELVILEDNARATLVEFFVSGDKGAQLAAGVNDLHAGAGSRLTYVGAQSWSDRTLAFQSNSIVAQRDARVLALNVQRLGNLGGKIIVG